MLIMLKTTCFGLWLIMMIMLMWADQAKLRQAAVLLNLLLDDPNRAEKQIYDSLQKLSPDTQLNLQIYNSNPYYPELYFIAACKCRKNPSILIRKLGLEGS